MSIDVDVATLESQGWGGYYFDLNGERWVAIGLVEKIFRALLGWTSLVDSTQTSCLRRFWDQADKRWSQNQFSRLPIRDVLIHALCERSPSFSQLETITRIFCKTHEKSYMTIEQDPKMRSFTIKGEKIDQKVYSTHYGRLDFYENNRLIAINSHGTLFKADGTISACHFGFSVVVSGEEVFIAAGTREKAVLVFRKAISQQVFAVGQYSKSEKKWTIFKLDEQNQIDSVHIAWAALKYSQQVHWEGPKTLPYVKAPPSASKST